MFNLFKKKDKQIIDVVPQHIAVIMDGNGRWAQKRGLPRTAGHREGSKNLKRIALYASELGVKAFTVYAFSTENWRRPEGEINYLMKLPKEFFGEFMPIIKKNNIRVVFIGDIASLNDEIRATINESMEETKNNTGMILAIALNYGSQDEICHAIKEIAIDYKDGNINLEDINHDLVERHLMTYGLPKIDLMIRTSGEYRLSNFLLWQLAYSEFYFTDVLWPDFGETEFLDAINKFNKRNRRYGGI